MSGKFGFLEKFEFLQDIVSIIIAKINNAVVHNVEKYLILKKTHYLSAIEHIDGAYLEFGIYKGSSFRHSIRCTKNLSKINPNLRKTKFIGFDSFSGYLHRKNISNTLTSLTIGDSSIRLGEGLIA